MNLYKLSFLIIFLFLFLGCTKKEGLELEILNSEFQAYSINKDKFTPSVRFNEDYFKKANNKVSFKITNYDTETYVLTPICIGDFNGLSLGNIIIQDESNTKINHDYSLVNYEWSDAEISSKFRDSIQKVYYNKLDYLDKSNHWKETNTKLINKMVVIHPNESLFFETYISLPINYNIETRDVSFVILDSDKNYNLKLQFENDIQNIENWLTKPQIKTFKTNNYKFYSSKLTSTNSVPIIFKKQTVNINLKTILLSKKISYFCTSFLEK